jgi:ABC-2 type transport system permease protein
MTTTSRLPGTNQLGVLKFGALQAKVEIINRFTRPSALGHLLVPIALVVIFLNVDVSDFLGGQGATGMLAGIAAASLFIGGFVGICGELVAEQDDGTMLRVRTLPYGLAGYLVGKTLSLWVTGVVTALLILIPADIFVSPILPGTVAGWASLTAVAILTLFATVPMGAVAGSLIKSPLAIFPISLVAYALMSVSGIFFSIASMPDWLTVPIKFFPVYWLGLLSRVTLVPGTTFDSVGQALLAIGVPVVWAVLGLILAPRALRVMTRRQSGARLEALAQRRAARGY